ncbi:TRAP transporter small permease [Alkalihalobacterium alkalinitrilicum]|uniref:TRAP transporter small permease n=1 Tax=Alkalihalobacterium alkalinitrilicum TaxID=427920 RepID=UPI0009950B90|nr:TRAP transporter small permease [Alkalihalobacterium alkalinitrilicum]
MKVLKTIINNIDRFLAVISSCALIALMLLVTANVLGRWLFSSPIVSTIEISSEYLMVIIVFLALSYTHSYKDHISVNILQQKFKGIWAKINRIIINVVGVTVCFTITYVYFLRTIEFYEKSIVSSSLLAYPLYPVMLMIAVGTFLFGLRMLLELVEMILGKDVQEEDANKL